MRFGHDCRRADTIGRPPESASEQLKSVAREDGVWALCVRWRTLGRSGDGHMWGKYLSVAMKQESCSV
jgi:hypothetical protein